MEPITKDDLRQFQMQLLYEIEKILHEKIKPTSVSNNEQSEWVRSKFARAFLSMSAGSLQNLRITGKIKFKKVLGTYYYYFPDLKKLFENGKE